jgi:hypothetical protein
VKTVTKIIMNLNMEIHLLQKHVHAKLMCPLRRLHEWYYLACVCGLQFIDGRIPEAVFKSRGFDINIRMFELHTIYWLRMLDNTLMIVMCSLVHVCDDQKRLRYMNVGAHKTSISCASMSSICIR